MFKCLECGHVFEEGEQAKWSESRGEFWGSACNEIMSGCPLCQGDYAETKPCEICGAEHLEDELISGVCCECIEDYSNNVEICYKVAEIEKENVKLNSFLASVLTTKEMEEILFNFVKQCHSKNKGSIQTSDFINEDKYWFVERVKEIENEK